MKDQEPTSENEPWPSSAPMKEKQASINSSGSSPKSSPDGSHETVDSDTKIKQNSSPQQKPSKIVVEEVDNFDSVGSGEIISSPKAQSNKSTSSSSSSSSTEDSSEKETTKNYPLSPKSKPGPDASVAESQEGMDSFGSTDTIEAPPKAKILSTTSLASGPQVKFFQPTYSSKLSRAISTESGMEQIEQKPQLIEQKTQTMLIKSAMKASTGVLEVTVKPMKPMFESDSIPDKRQSYPPKSAGKIPDLDSQDKRQSYPPDASNTQKKVNWKATSPPLSTSKEKETPNSDPSHLGSSLKPSKSQGPDSDSKFKVSIQTESKKAEKHRKNELDYEKDSNLARTVLEKDLNKLSIEAFKIIEAEKEIIKTKVEVDFDDSKPILYYPSRDVTENEFLKQALNTFRKTFQKSLQTSFQELQHEFDLKKIQIISEIQEKYANEIHEVKMETQKQGDNKVQAEIASLSKLNESRLKQVRIQAEDDFKLEEEKLKQHFERKREIAKEEVASQQASFNELQRKANDEITHESWVKELSLGEPNDGENLSEILPKMDVNVQNTTSPMRKSKKKAAKSRKSGRKSKTSEISVKCNYF